MIEAAPLERPDGITTQERESYIIMSTVGLTPALTVAASVG
jgi:hypothetical protein